MEECNLWSQMVQQFNESCFDLDGLWMKRRRRFDTSSMIQSLMQLVGGAQKSYQLVLDRLNSDSSPSASSFCEARSKFPSNLIGEVRDDLLDSWDGEVSGFLWNGFRLHAVDGSKVSLPRKLFEYGFSAAPGGHCPQGLVSLLVRLDDRMVCDINLTDHEDERLQAHDHLEKLSSNDLVIYDRGYLSFALVTAHIQQGIAAVFRVPKVNTFKPIESFWKSRSRDKIVTLDPTSVTYRTTAKRHPDYEYGPIQVRLIKYKIAGSTYVLATTVLDLSIPTEEYAELYSKRWFAEENFKAFKQTLEMETFHSKSRNGVAQEIQAIGLLWNLTRKLGHLAGYPLKKIYQLPTNIPLPNQFTSKSVRA